MEGWRNGGMEEQLTNRKIMLIVLVLLPLIFTCSNEKRANVFTSRGMYYWKTVFSLNDKDVSVLSRLRISRLYLRIADIIYNQKTNQPEPSAPVSMHSAIPENMEMIPVLFITPDVFKKADNKAADSLASNILKLFSGFSKAAGKEIKEAQIDYDWTPSTRERYFYFLEKIQNLAKKRGLKYAFSCTVRLHQVRFRQQTGVPPVDRAVLMAYNMQSGPSYSQKNGIFDLNELEKYINNKTSYPLEMGLVLPIFSQACLYRNSRIIGIFKVNNIKDLENNKWLYKAMDSNYIVKHRFNVFGREMAGGDVIKIEAVNTDDIKNGVIQIKKKVNTGGTISLFDYNGPEGFDDEKISLLDSVFNN